MASSLEIEQMKQIQKVARAYFDAKEEDDRILAMRFFRSLDDNSDGKLSLEEYKRHVDPRFSSDHLFKLLDSNGDGTLELEEFLALYCMDNVLIPRCSACHVMLLGYSYFSCLPCFGHTSYHICCSCYGAGSFDHRHESTQFADTRALLKLVDRLMAEAEVATAQPDLPQEEVRRSCMAVRQNPYSHLLLLLDLQLLPKQTNLTRKCSQNFAKRVELENIEMEEAAVSFVLREIRDLVVAEGKLLSGVGEEVEELQKQLKEMACFLEDADKKRHQNKSISNWLIEMRDLTDRARDAIEVHAARVLYSRRRRGFRQVVTEYACIMKKCSSLHELATDISKIKSDLEKLTNKLQESGVTRSIMMMEDRAESSSSDLENLSRQTYPNFLVGDCFVGMEDEMKKLEDFLVNEDDKEQRVISVWGMGGLGKTTIARKVYNNIISRKERCFDRFAWVCISQKCEILSVLANILAQLKGETYVATKILEEASLISQLCELQKDKRCLIVVDDLWELSYWDPLKKAFLIQHLQTKVLITTRKRHVAEIGFPVKLGFLNESDALELLKKKAFFNKNLSAVASKENIDKVGKVMVQKCGYLPLAISLLGGVLSKKEILLEDWELVKEKINSYIYEDEKEIDGVLNLSYENLPFHLKPCFLCMGILKEDESISSIGLYRMWIAQGMIISRDNIEDKEKTSREIAEGYLLELASRSIIQVEVDASEDGKRYKLHDVIRELCLKIGRKNQFGVQTLEYEVGKCCVLTEEPLTQVKIQHLAIHFNGNVDHTPQGFTISSGDDSSTHLRSLNMVYSKGIPNPIEFPTQNIVDFQKFILLRDLVFEGFKFAGRKLPRGISNLVHLRCLTLKYCVFDELPSSVRKLVYLETLNLFGSMNVRVPYVFKDMLLLKHLLLPWYNDLEILGNCRLVLDEGVYGLETLKGVDSRVHDIKCMDKMKKLQRFGARIHDNESFSSILDVIATEWNKLVYCEVGINDGCEIGKSEEGLKKALTCPNLHSLIIGVKVGKVLAKCASDIISSKITMVSLTRTCEMEDDPMGILGLLPSLKQLVLFRGSYVGEEMTCPAFSFPSLNILRLQSLPNLREWRVESGAFPILSQLHIEHCSALEMLPDGLSNILALLELTIKGMPELEKRLSSPSGEDLHKIRHVQKLIIN